MKIAAMIALLLSTTAAIAQDTLTKEDRSIPYPDVVQRPSDETIRRALMGAYERNGYSMVGMGSIDMSGEYSFDKPVLNGPIKTKKGDRK
jgi:hypothetical protein